ncbi:hypothetical protein [Mycobacteroides abscessus]|uniref:hypothetical protein n=1 Tax=Mycobacteroides abscessus TaxID=36809 RepID=UPI0009C6FEC4|nr:hypothetical protein [Mycobacteroides abscessus]SLH42703.1 Uncharacterised protein [Mycobacteroides abscessus subsp. abscessus]
MKKSIARVLRNLANRFDPPSYPILNIHNINGLPTTEDQRRVMQAQQKLNRAMGL